ncbi:MAG: nitrate reductase cytochrome c-type subunit [Planctomycetota bacterium]|jgi:cytochrome c-type protein NapB
MRKFIIVATLAVSVLAAAVQAQDYVATLRAPTPLDEQPTAPAVPKVADDEGRRQRSFPEQPPTMDRDGQILAAVSPRRYFCNQCHVVEHRVKPLVGNDFMDVDAVLSR